MALSDLDLFIKGLPQPSSYLDSGFDLYLDKNLFVSESNQTSAADLMNSAEGFHSSALDVDLIKGSIIVRDPNNIVRAIIGNV